MAVTITYETPDWIYEGSDPSQFESISGQVTNRAPKQIQQNILDLKNYINTVVADAIDKANSALQVGDYGIGSWDTSVNLTGQIQSGDFKKSVIALCKLDNTNKSLNSWSSGTITFHKSNGNGPDIKVDIEIEKKYNTTVPIAHLRRNIRGLATPRVCTFTYNGIKYGGIEFYYDNANSDRVIWNGVGNFNPFGVDYYDTKNNVALNSEIDGSLNFTEGDIEQGNYWHSGNDGAGSGLDADTLAGLGSSDFARNDLSNVDDSVLSSKMQNIGGSGSGLDADLLDGLDSTAFAKNDLSNVDDSTVLNKVKNTDGSGSGLDADLLDGKDSSYFQPVSSAITTDNIGSQSVANATKWNGSTQYTSTADPSGGNDGDIWFKY